MYFVWCVFSSQEIKVVLLGSLYLILSSLVFFLPFFPFPWFATFLSWFLPLSKSLSFSQQWLRSHIVLSPCFLPFPSSAFPFTPFCLITPNPLRQFSIHNYPPSSAVALHLSLSSAFLSLPSLLYIVSGNWLHPLCQSPFRSFSSSYSVYFLLFLPSFSAFLLYSPHLASRNKLHHFSQSPFRSYSSSHTAPFFPLSSIFPSLYPPSFTLLISRLVILCTLFGSLPYPATLPHTVSLFPSFSVRHRY